MITNCIGGGNKDSFMDIVECSSDVLPGDMFLLCSDGLTDMLPEDEIAQLLAEDSHADLLCRAAEEKGGFDNVSALVAKVL